MEAKVLIELLEAEKIIEVGAAEVGTKTRTGIVCNEMIEAAKRELEDKPGVTVHIVYRTKGGSELDTLDEAVRHVKVMELADLFQMAGPCAPRRELVYIATWLLDNYNVTKKGE